jgi:hypothetical protein
MHRFPARSLLPRLLDAHPLRFEEAIREMLQKEIGFRATQTGQSRPSNGH